MNLTDRDRKILIAVVPVLVALAYWFLLLAPKREQAATAADELATQEQRLDAAKATGAGLGTAQTDFAVDYTELVRLGKAVPSSVDMPSLIVQLESAAQGTNIRFSRIATGDRAAAAAAAGAAAGGPTAQSGPGKAAESAGDAAQSSNDKSAASESSTGATDTKTSEASGKGVPVGGGAATDGQPAADGSAGPAGLDTVPLELEFQGRFFDLADFFHRLKRYVQVKGDQIDVRGRLLSIDSLKFSSTPEIFPRLKAEIKATVYLVPKAEGETAGATPTGPGSSTPATSSSSQVTPSAAATP